LHHAFAKADAISLQTKPIKWTIQLIARAWRGPEAVMARQTTGLRLAIFEKAASTSQKRYFAVAKITAATPANMQNAVMPELA